VEQLVRIAWQLGEHPTYDGLRRWVHMIGFRGHFASKSRRYSTALGAIRGERRAYRQRQAAEHVRELLDEDRSPCPQQPEHANDNRQPGMLLNAKARSCERNSKVTTNVIPFDVVRFDRDEPISLNDLHKSRRTRFLKSRRAWASGAAWPMSSSTRASFPPRGWVVAGSFPEPGSTPGSMSSLKKPDMFHISHTPAGAYRANWRDPSGRQRAMRRSCGPMFSRSEELATQQDRSRSGAGLGDGTWQAALPRCRRQCYQLTGAVLRSAVSNRLLAFNPCEDIRLPPRRKHDSDERIITREELVTVLLPAMPDRYRAIVAIAGGAGLRCGEAAACAPTRSTSINADLG
jgi:hypothetical protein